MALDGFLNTLMMSCTGYPVTFSTLLLSVDYEIDGCSYLEINSCGMVRICVFLKVVSFKIFRITGCGIVRFVFRLGLGCCAMLGSWISLGCAVLVN